MVTKVEESRYSDKNVYGKPKFGFCFFFFGCNAGLSTKRLSVSEHFLEYFYSIGYTGITAIFRFF